MSERIFLSPPWMGGSERRLVGEAFDSNYIAPCGPMVDRFERDVSARTGLPYALAVSGGTAALELAYRELGIGAGDVVLCSDLTFIASVGPAVRRGARPVFIDADPASWTMDVGLLEQALDENVPRVRAAGRRLCVTAVDLYGQCCDYDAIEALCRRYGVPLLVDSAEALGATYRGRSAGDAGFASVFSFNGNKIITTSGGGMLMSRDAEVVARARKRSQQSRENCVWYEHREVGYNYRLSNVAAAIGVGQLELLDEILRRKRSIFAGYASSFAGRLTGMPEAGYGECSRWLSVFTVPTASSDFTQPVPEVRARIERLAAIGVESRPVWKPMHLQPCFAGCAFYGKGLSERLFATGICLPSGAGLTEEQQLRIIESLLDGHLT